MGFIKHAAGTVIGDTDQQERPGHDPGQRGIAVTAGPSGESRCCCACEECACQCLAEQDRQSGGR